MRAALARRAHRASHLVRRFFGTLWPSGPRPGEERWVESLLRPGELALWRAMPAPDRRHAAAVARRVDAGAGGAAGADLLAAALLHDVGKAGAGLGAFGRAAATVTGALASRDRVGAWGAAGGWRGRFFRYLRHDQVGAELLARAGGREMAVSWAACHHRRPDAWTVPRQVGELLKAADDD
jgi:hypothetical protein